MRRKLFTIIAALLLVLATLNGLLWLLAACGLPLAIPADRQYSPDFATYRVSSKGKGILLAMNEPHTPVRGPASGSAEYRTWEKQFGHHRTAWWFAGFEYGASPVVTISGNYLPPSYTEFSAVSRQLLVPYWSIFAVTLPVPLCWAWVARRRWIARRRIRLGLCLTCGYDLRASSERCPECGVAISTTKNTKGTKEAAA